MRSWTLKPGALGLLLFVGLCFTSQATPNANLIDKGPFTIFPFALPDQYKAQFSGYRSDWHRITGFEYSGLHWKKFVVIYVNKGYDVYRKNYFDYLRVYQNEDEDDDKAESMEPNFSTYEEGTIFIKENYTAENGSPAAPLSMSVMIKHKPGYAPKAGDWQYLEVSPQGDILMTGSDDDPKVSAACSSCHLNMADRDYVFSTFYSQHSGEEK